MDVTGMSALKTSPKLLAMIKQASTHEMTPAERREQRLSFVMGSLSSENRLTRDEVRAILDKHDGIPVLPPVDEIREAIRQALADAGRDICQSGSRTLCEWQADAVMKALRDLGVIPGGGA